MPEAAVMLPYDPAPFEKGISRTLASLDRLTDKVGGVAGQIVKKLLFVGVAIKGVQFLWQKFIQGAPEVGRVFGIASDIFFKNFFYPLRRALLPFLQGLLDWVRNNRATFVRWGQVVANIFTALVGVAKAFWGILKMLAEIVGKEFRAVFGQSFMDLINLFLAKLAVLGVYVGNVFQSIREPITFIVGLVGDLVSGLFQFGKFLVGLATSGIRGFIDAVQGIGSPLKGIIDLVVRFLKSLEDLDKRTGVFTGTIRALGAVLGEALMTVLFAIQGALLAVVQGFEMIPNLIGSALALIHGNKQQQAQFAAERQMLASKDAAEWANYGKQVGAYYMGQGKTWQNVGEAFHAPTPTPAAVAAVSPGERTGVAGLGAANANYVINVNITGGVQNPEDTGRRVGAALYNELQRQKAKGGG